MVGGLILERRNMEELLRMLNEYWNSHDAISKFGPFDNVFDMEDDDYNDIKNILLQNNFIVDYEINVEVAGYINRYGGYVTASKPPAHYDPYMYQKYDYIIDKDNKRLIIELIREPSF